MLYRADFAYLTYLRRDCFVPRNDVFIMIGINPAYPLPL